MLIRAHMYQFPPVVKCYQNLLIPNMACSAGENITRQHDWRADCRLRNHV